MGATGSVVLAATTLAGAIAGLVTAIMEPIRYFADKGDVSTDDLNDFNGTTPSNDEFAYNSLNPSIPDNNENYGNPALVLSELDSLITKLTNRMDLSSQNQTAVFYLDFLLAITVFFWGTLLINCMIRRAPTIHNILFQFYNYILLVVLIIYRDLLNYEKDYFDYPNLFGFPYFLQLVMIIATFILSLVLIICPINVLEPKHRYKLYVVCVKITLCVMYFNFMLHINVLCAQQQFISEFESYNKSPKYVLLGIWPYTIISLIWVLPMFFSMDWAQNIEFAGKLEK